MDIILPPQMESGEPAKNRNAQFIPCLLTGSTGSQLVLLDSGLGVVAR